MKLACFDLDGTLFDTRNVNFYAYQEALKNKGYDMEYDYYTKECNGRHYTEFLPHITNNATKETIEQIHSDKKVAYGNHLDKTKVNQRLFDIIEGLKKEKYKLAVVTTASKKNTIDILKYYQKEELFDYIITSEDYTEKKPSPMSYILAMEMAEVTPEQTLIFEDSEVGIRAAVDSGATVFIVGQF